MRERAATPASTATRAALDAPEVRLGLPPRPISSLSLALGPSSVSILSQKIVGNPAGSSIGRRSTSARCVGAGPRSSAMCADRGRPGLPVRLRFGSPRAPCCAGPMFAAMQIGRESTSTNTTRLNEKSLGKEESVPEHVVKRRQCDARCGAGPGGRSRASSSAVDQPCNSASNSRILERQHGKTAQATTAYSIECQAAQCLQHVSLRAADLCNPIRSPVPFSRQGPDCVSAA